MDLPAQHRALEKELMAVFSHALGTASFIGGPQVQSFEEEFASFCGARHCVGVGSGTDALRFALLAAGVGPGDGVITVPMTFIATTEAISQVGARPIFVDVEESTSNMDPNRLEDLLGRIFGDRGFLCHSGSSWKPKAVVPVHLYGHPAHMDPILELAQRYELLVIEDACQAHGAEYLSGRIGNRSTWRKVGTMGAAAAFSFYPGKNLGACGEAGAVVTDDDEIARRVRMIRDHGQSQKYYHEMEGYNGRLDAIQAGILRIKLRHLPGWNQLRRDKAAVYNELLGSMDNCIVPGEAPYARCVYHLYVIRVARRDQLHAHLMRKGIGCGLHYPLPLHLQRAYKHLAHKEGDFPVAEKLAREVISLPFFPEITREQQQAVAEAVKEFLSGKV
ncbi:MAG: DegT/DnrJ/EryC1/StrS family aminotransferase [Thermodesulfobacteriota bacterium]